MDEKTKLKKEIDIVKEIIALREKRDSIGYSQWMEMEQKTIIPPRYRHLLDQRTDELEQHLARLEEDLEDLQNLQGEFNNSEFRKESEFRRGRRIQEDQEDEEEF